MIERVVDGFAHEAAGQEPPLGFQPHQGTMQPRQHRSAETRSFGLAQLRAGSRLSQLVFEGVKVLEVFEEPPRYFRRGLAGVVKLCAAHEPGSRGEHDLAATAPGKAVVGFVTVALDGAAEVHGDDVLQARCGTARLPMEDDISTRNATGPEVTQLGPAMSRREIADRCFIDLHVAAAEHALLDLLVNGLEPLRGQPDPFRHRLPWQPDLMARPVDRLLPVERKMIAILGSRRSAPAVPEPRCCVPGSSRAAVPRWARHPAPRAAHTSDAPCAGAGSGRVHSRAVR